LETASNIVPFKAPAPPGRRPPRTLVLDLDELVAAVALVFRVEPAEVMLGRTKAKSAAAARHVVLWAMRTMWVPQPSFPEIGRMLGGRDHTTAMNAVKRIEREIETGSEVGRIALEFYLEGVPRS
jgi:chromosomal replication initiator protein